MPSALDTLYRYLVLFSITQVRRDVHYKRKRAPHMGHRFRLLHNFVLLLIGVPFTYTAAPMFTPWNSKKNIRPRSLPNLWLFFLRYHASPRQNVHPYWYSGRCPAHCSNGESYCLPVSSNESEAITWPALDPAPFRDSLPPAQRHRHPLFGLALQSGEAHIAGRALNDKSR